MAAACSSGGSREASQDAGTAAVGSATRRTIRADTSLFVDAHARFDRRRIALPFEATGRDDARFAVRGRDLAAHFTNSGFALSLVGADARHGLHASLVGARDVAPSAEAPSTVRSFHGLEPRATYERVVWEEVYPGVDMVATPSGGGFSYAFVVGPEADLGRVELAWAGAREIRVDPAGRDAEVVTDMGEVHVRGLHAFEIVGRERREVRARHVARGTALGVEIEGWSRRGTLVIDPAISFSTYLGGANGEGARAVGTDAAGNVIVAGWTTSADFPTTPGLDRTLGPESAFVTKLSPTGALVWSTYLDGASIAALAVDGAGAVYLTGTAGTGLPILNAAQPTPLGGSEAFAAKVTSAGVLEWATYLSGGYGDNGSGIAVNASNVVVTGTTRGNGFPIKNAFYSTDPAIAQFAFVTRFSLSGSLLSSTYLGALNMNTQALALALDTSGAIFVGGRTGAPDFPVRSSFGITFNGGLEDGFVAKIRPDASAIEWAAFVGGTGNDSVQSVAVDGNNDLFVSGFAEGGLPASGDFKAGYGPSRGDFVARLRGDGTAPIWVRTDISGKLARTAGGDLFVAAVGSVRPVEGGFQTVAKNRLDAGLSRLTGRGNLIWATFLGGSSDDELRDIATDPSGNVLLVGSTQSTDFPVVSAFDTTLGGTSDAFVTKVLQPQLAAGVACTAGTECASGRCADGVCCDRTCGGCEACTAALKGSGANGVCGPIAAGTDPRNACAPDAGYPANCKADGFCDGAGKCRTLAPSGVQCAAQTCSAATVTSARQCDGAGTCRPATNASCGTFACAGAQCATTCSTDAQCSTGNFCQGTTCVTKRANGAACSAGRECGSGQCVDGVCCNVACGGRCQACTAAKKGKGTDGTCESIIDGTDPDDECTGDVCVSGTFNQQVCDGAGACRAMPTSCGAFGCNAGGTSCANSCAGDGDCGADSYCDAAKTCQKRRASGATCTRRAECLASAFCVDGVCCETACTGACEACNVAGREGACVPVAGAPRPGHPPCAGDGTNCAGTCDGVNAATCNYPTAAISCADGCKEGQIARCDGAGACLPKTACPGNFACDGTSACKSACAVDGDCARGFQCEGTKCVPRKPASCSPDGLRSIPSDPANPPVTCAPYRCGPAGTCLPSCATSDDCAPDHTCDPARRLCVASGGDTGEEGGCTVANARSKSRVGVVMLLAVLSAALLRRRRAKAP
jgi:hypothetical protein